MSALEELVRTLLYEGYALYPYTPGATKNATPTPFGIVYPPVYAAGSPATFARIRMQGIAKAAIVRRGHIGRRRQMMVDVDAERLCVGGLRRCPDGPNG